MKTKSKLKKLREVDLTGDVDPVSYSLPDDLSQLPSLPELSSRELGEFYSRCANYLGYLNEQIAVGKMGEANAKTKFRRKKAEALAEATGAFKAKQFAKVRCRVDVQELENGYLISRMKVIAWQANLWTIKSYLDACRFELDRRRCEFRTELNDEV